MKYLIRAEEGMIVEAYRYSGAGVENKVEKHYEWVNARTLDEMGAPVMPTDRWGSTTDYGYDWTLWINVQRNEVRVGDFVYKNKETWGSLTYSMFDLLFEPVDKVEASA